MSYHKEIKVALMVIVGLVSFYLGFRYIRGKEIFSNTSTYYATFSDIGGLLVEDPVLVNGYKVGKVKSIELLMEKEGKVRVGVAIQKGIPVGKKSIVTLVNRNMLGSKQLSMSLATKDPLAPGGMLQSGMQKDILNAASDELSMLGDSLRITAHLLNEGLRKAHTIEDKVPQVVERVEDLLSQVQLMVEENRSSLHQSLNNVSDITTHLSHTTHYVDTLLTSGQVQHTMENLSLVSEHLQHMIADLREGKGTLGKLTTDDALYLELKATIISLNTLLKHLDEAPKDFLAPLGRSRKKIEQRRQKSKGE